MPDFTIKANDTRPPLVGWVGYPFSASAALPEGWIQTRPADLEGQGRLALPGSTYFSGATLQFIMRKARATNLADDSTYTVDTTVTTAKVAAAATWLDSTTGQFRYSWSPGSTNTPSPYLGEVEVTFADGGVETFPRDSYFTILIPADLDAAS